MEMILQGNFFHKGKKHRLILKEHELKWNTEASPDLGHSALLSEIISCWVCPKGSRSCSFDAHEEPGECPHWKKGRGGLAVEVSRRTEGRRWTTRVVVFLHEDRHVLFKWYHGIWEALRELEGRPHKVLVVINPVSGRRKGSKLYRKKVASLFHRARIETIEKQTEYRGHGCHLIQEVASNGLLSSCDGIVAVGGDGLASEVITGVFLTAASTSGIDTNDSRIGLPVTSVRVGIIPSGSTDATCFATHGSNDVVTAALHIVMGDRRAVDVASIHSDGALQRVVTSLISYGYFGDLLQSSENWRWLGPPRYVLSGLQQILKNKTYPVKIKVRKNVHSASSSNSVSNGQLYRELSCSSLCSVCSKVEGEQDLQHSTVAEDDWEEMVGDYSIVSAAVTSCACRLTPQGVSPNAHLGDGFTDLILVDGDSRTKLLSYLYHTSVTGNAANLEHVKMVRTNEIHLTASREVFSLFNCDGEELKSTSLTIRVHRQKLQLFCRGLEDVVDSNPKSSTLPKS